MVQLGKNSGHKPLKNIYYVYYLLGRRGVLLFTLSEEETPVKARSRRRLGILVAVLAVVLLAAAGFAAYFLTRDKGIGDYVVREESSVRIASPEGNTALVLTTADGQLRYQVERDGRPFTEAGALGVKVTAWLTERRIPWSSWERLRERSAQTSAP